ncbi:MAG TPA: HEAT repeat domain-containing protein, partial [Phycisphaerales bacterium]|nr:HEAT repeat domain-containing protein [Phycisphaerales bacterium]
GEAMLTKFLSSRRADHESYAVSACAAIPFLATVRRKRLLAVARKHKSPDVQMEAAWAGAKVGDKQAIDFLCERCLDRGSSLRAQHYLSELGHKRLIPKAVKSRDFFALATMCDWLSHPNEYGAAPDAIELMDKRTIYWPPTRDERELRLFKFSYQRPHGQDEPATGVGMVGSVTWAFFDETNPTMSPEHIYGTHCCWELSIKDDPRTPKKRSGSAGWKLITKRA